MDKNSELSYDELYECAKLINVAYNNTIVKSATSCYEWWPNGGISRIPEGCFVAIVKSYLIKPEDRMLF